MQGDSGVGEHSGVGHPRKTLTLELGTPGHFGVGHSRDERGVDRARRRVPGEEKS